jgi:hypothetical protein
MISLDQKRWEGGTDVPRGAPSKCPKSFDELAYARGYVKGNAEYPKRTRLSVATSSKTTTRPRWRP